jgi:hypothetical protein
MPAREVERKESGSTRASRVLGDRLVRQKRLSEVRII